MPKTFEELVGGFRGDASRIIGLYNAINKTLAEQGIGKVNEGGSPISELILKGEQNPEIWIQVRDIIIAANSLSSRLDSSFDQSQLEHVSEIERERDKSWETRKNLWKLWGEKYVRWALGLLLAVFMYSAFTYHTEGSDFWKIPVKSTVEKFIIKPE